MLKQITEGNMDRYLCLAQDYEEEFVPFTGAVRDETGAYPLSTPTAETHLGYYYCEDGVEAGFIVISTNEEPYDVCEFFVLQEFRKKGIGQKLAFEVFDLYDADWTVKQLYAAENARLFWIKVIDKYTGGAFTQNIYEDKKWGKVHMQKFSSKDRVCI